MLMQTSTERQYEGYSSDNLLAGCLALLLVWEIRRGGEVRNGRVAY